MSNVRRLPTSDDALERTLAASIAAVEGARRVEVLVHVARLRGETQADYDATLQTRGVGKPRESLYAVVKASELLITAQELENCALRACLGGLMGVPVEDLARHLAALVRS